MHTSMPLLYNIYLQGNALKCAWNLCRATQGSTRLGQEAGGAGQHQQEALLWLS